MTQELRTAVCVLVPVPNGFERFRMFPDTVDQAYRWLAKQVPIPENWVIQEEAHTWKCDHDPKDYLEVGTHPEHEIESFYRFMPASTGEWIEGPKPTLELVERSLREGDWTLTVVVIK